MLEEAAKADKDILVMKKGSLLKENGLTRETLMRLRDQHFSLTRQLLDLKRNQLQNENPTRRPSIIMLEEGPN
jgi:hypothetical protein